jgi:SAM-dependent methyltransferase
MTAALAERFDDVLAVDVSPAMLARAQGAVSARNVTFSLVSGDRLDGVPGGIADAVVCYLVLQHLPSSAAVRRYLHEFARVLAPTGEAFLQIPIIGGARGRLWRAARAPAVILARRPDRRRAFRGFRLAGAELTRALAQAHLRVVAEDEGPSPYRYCRDRFLRLVRE